MKSGQADYGRGVARPGHTRAVAGASSYFALPSAAFPAVQVIKVYIAISYSTKKFPKPLFSAQWTDF